MFKLLLLLFVTLPLMARDPLPSWNDTPLKQALISFAINASDPKSSDFIPAADRIAVFDNDGTLWSERPLYFQLFFALDRVRALAPDHPEWKTTEPFASVLKGDMHGVMKSGEHGLLELVTATHAGMDVEMFQNVVKSWLAQAKHPTLQRPYTELVFRPMLELIRLLEAHRFSVYIVSGGGIDFMRVFIPETYGIPSERIIGSVGKVHYENGKIYKDADIAFINDKAAKPVAIYRAIGKYPAAAFGNSDGDLAMLQYTDANPHYKTLKLYVHHTDAKREFAYDRNSPIGRLDKGLDYGREHHWNIVDMAQAWKKVY